MRPRHGFTLVECIIAGLLGTLLLAMLASTLVVHEHIAAALAEHLAYTDATRTPAVLLHAELRALDPRSDLRALGRDSLSVRAFRGAAVICAAADDTVIVAYRGSREPEPAKDSLLLIGPAGTDVRALRDIETRPPRPGCSLTPLSRTFRLRLDARAAQPALLLFFESGTYSLNTNAFRYRRGEEGRQPLTPDRLDNASAFRGVRQPGDSALRGIQYDLRTRSLPHSPNTPNADGVTSFLNASPDTATP